ncbi:hypothetical protein [Aquimarina algiphila]|uniref:hypothetical protein n=1 Tax=Aquimarina algiphila TaxID=2047982 RepID=UPI00232E2199|nr:hypothetical protein [Aquimarina algiphila]
MMKNNFFLVLSFISRKNKNYIITTAMVCAAVFFGDTIMAQNESYTSVPARRKSRLTIDGVSYVGRPSLITHFSPGKQSSFTVNYEFSTNFHAEIEGHYYLYDLMDVFIVSFIVPISTKQYVSDRLYLFTGGEVEFTRSFNYGAEPIPPIFKMINGVGYDVNANFSLEVKQDLNFNTTTLAPYNNPNMFSVKGKFKF